MSIAEFLIDSGANVNHTSEQHGTALYIACSKSGTFSGEGIEDVVSSLLHHGAHLNNKVHESHNPLNAVLDVSHRTYSSEPTPPDLIIEMLLSRFPNLRVTGENLVKAAEADTHRSDKKPYLELLLGHDQLVQVPEAAIWAVLSPHLRFNEKLIKLLLDRYWNGTVSEEMLKTAPSISSLNLLLQHPNVCQISPALTQDELSKKDGLQRVAMLLNNNAELRLDENVISTASKLISTDPSSANLNAFRTIWLRYKSQDDEETTRSLEQLGISLYIISALDILR